MENKGLKLLVILVVIAFLVHFVGIFNTLLIALIVYTIKDLIRLKTFIKWFILGIVFALFNVPVLFFVCVITGGILMAKEQSAKIDEEYKERNK